MWEVFYSSNFVHEFLLERYKQEGREDAEKKSYNNCYPFMYYLQHGKSFMIPLMKRLWPSNLFYYFMGMYSFLKRVY